ncbi:MAG: dTDP-4-dehydrorhamnose 3,5-epimerase family protein [Candidatus Paceibacterota bacterium]|jgi:dTDP-4-dehydrorhamnose 3,5-epimerase-like enzyme
MNIIYTNIDGLVIKLNKVVGDERGYLYEIAPGGNDNELINGKIGNVYSSTATQKGVARGGHYHHKLIEHFYTLSGTCLWIFKDFRDDSKTKGKTFTVLAGEKDENINIQDVDGYFLPESMAQILVPQGVYHVFYPLTDKKAEVLAITNLPHDNDDYVRIDPKKDEDMNKILDKLRF